MPPPPSLVSHSLLPYLGGAVVAPNGDAGDTGVELPALQRQLAARAVLVQAGQLGAQRQVQGGAANMPQLMAEDNSKTL